MRFWADMDNAPHVLVLRPIIEALRALGHEVEVTARDHGQTFPLLRMYGMQFRPVGRHWGKNKFMKYLSVLTRAVSLVIFAKSRGFNAAFCHGARSLFFAARILRIPIVALDDYEHTMMPAFMLRWIWLQMAPDVIPADTFEHQGLDVRKFCPYPGLKENLYIHDLQPDPSVLAETGMDPSKVLILMRPPATMAHYAVPESERFFFDIMEYLCVHPEVQILLIPRTAAQKKELERQNRERGWTNVFLPDRVHEGPRMMMSMDILISGGGTMNREAAALGIPAYSIYQGPIGAVDRYLVNSGRLVLLSDIGKVKKIPLVKKQGFGEALGKEHGVRALSLIAEKIIECGSKNSRNAVDSAHGSDPRQDRVPLRSTRQSRSAVSR